MKKLVLAVALLLPVTAWAQSGVLLEVTPKAQVVALPTQIPTAFAATPFPFPNATSLRAVRINNQFNVDIWCTYGRPGATPAPFTVPAQSQHYENFASNGARMSSSVNCIRPAATPASGTLQVWGYE